MRTQLISPAVTEPTSGGYYKREERTGPALVPPMSPLPLSFSDTATPVTPKHGILTPVQPKEVLEKEDVLQLSYVHKESDAVIEKPQHRAGIGKRRESLVDEYRELEHSFHLQVSRANDLERTKESVTFELERRTERCKHLEGEVARQHDLVKRLEADIDNLDRHLLEEREINKRQSFQIKELQCELNRAVDDLQHFYLRESKPVDFNLSALEQENRKLKLINEQLNRELEQAARDNSAAESKTREMARELEEVKRQRSMFDSVLGDAERKIEQGATLAHENQRLKERIKELENNAGQDRNTMAEHIAAAAAQEATIQKLRADLKVARETLADVEDSYHNSSSSASTLQTELNEVLASNAKCEKELKAALEAKHDMLHEIESLRREASRLQGEKEAAVAQTKVILHDAEEGERKRQRVENDLRELHMHTQSRQTLNNVKEWEAVRAVLEKRLASWAQDNEALQHQLTIVRRERDTAKDALLALQQEQATQRSLDRSIRHINERWSQQRPMM